MTYCASGIRPGLLFFPNLARVLHAWSSEG